MTNETNDNNLIFTDSGGNPVAKYLRILILLAVKCPHPGSGGVGSTVGGGCGANGADHDNYQNTAHCTVALGLDICCTERSDNNNKALRKQKSIANYKQIESSMQLVSHLICIAGEMCFLIFAPNIH